MKFNSLQKQQHDMLKRVDGQEVRLMLWDTAGQEEFDAITKAYYRGAQACVVAFSTVDKDSFLTAAKWKKKVENECGKIPTALVQNKIDLEDSSVIKRDEAEKLSQEMCSRLFRTSVKEDKNVGTVFTHLAERYLARLRAWEQDQRARDDILTTPSIHTISAFTALPSSQNGKVYTLGRPDSNIITLRPWKARNSTRKRVFKNACKLL